MAQDFNKFPFQNQPYASKVFNTNQNHPLIPSAQQYSFYKKYVSIHSEDRDIIKYPNASNFEIEMPEDLINVYTISLSNWSFPSNYDTFSSLNSNVIMTFNINNPYNPGLYNLSSPYYSAIFKALFINSSIDYTIIIQSGFYNPDQMVSELTNKFNYAVSQRISNFLQDTTSPYYDPITFPEFFNQFESSGGYNNFVIVYNAVSQKIWFGNKSDGFILTNETQFNPNSVYDNHVCLNKNQIPNFSTWGLPANLGLTRNNITSINGSTLQNNSLDPNLNIVNGVITPRFYFGDVFPGDQGYWLLPNPYLPGSQVNWIECPNKINLMGSAYFYLELEGQNCIDETSPYNLSSFTSQTNQTNGIVNSSFAKIAVPTTPISQWFDRDSMPYKEYMPPADRIRKLKIKIRYHNGQLVDFGIFDYSLMFEFTMLQPTQARSYTNSFTPNVSISK
jgi:hypothetical protein